MEEPQKLVLVHRRVDGLKSPIVQLQVFEQSGPKAFRLVEQHAGDYCRKEFARLVQDGAIVATRIDAEAGQKLGQMVFGRGVLQ